MKFCLLVEFISVGLWLESEYDLSWPNIIYCCYTCLSMCARLACSESSYYITGEYVGKGFNYHDNVRDSFEAREVIYTHPQQQYITCRRLRQKSH